MPRRVPEVLSEAVVGKLGSAFGEMLRNASRVRSSSPALPDPSPRSDDGVAYEILMLSGHNDDGSESIVNRGARSHLR